MSREREHVEDRPSLENLVESGVVGLESLHPGGLALTTELAGLCEISAGTRVLDVACGTGESACYLAEERGAVVSGLDQSEDLLARARGKTETMGASVELHRGDAEALPFADDRFDVAVCECTLCLLDKEAALAEMVRVVRPGGRVGIHDLFWEEDAPDSIKDRLAEREGERPETLAGWKRLFEQAGLVDIATVDRSELKGRWMRDMRTQLGLSGQVALVWHVIRRWGFAGLRQILESERVFSNRHLGYALVVGVRP